MGNVLSASFAPECDLPKKNYDDCFAKWYGEKFLQAKSVHNECEDTWREYEDCLYIALEKKGIRTNMTKGDTEFEKYRAQVVHKGESANEALSANPTIPPPKLPTPGDASTASK
ncbi:hypothetical protein DV452_002712 [Geotrichum candidum]|nr:hypothetical protein DV454_003246 [Geotrichum candidum]KAF5116245.1 hypothetical protein DV452_002712 [Geotrichum candidum]KAI8135466.1 hypothetical protein DUD61_000834 [Geotrichum candidum]KAI9214607.1 hypothetical protein DS838_000557 [Geotrichum bryndzae]